MTPRSDLVTFGDVRVDLAAERVWKGDELAELEPKAFGVLRYLLDHPDRLVSKQEIFDVVWHGTAVTDNALTRVVAQLRRAIGDDARDARFIETVPTRGYRFIGEIRRVEAATADAPHTPGEAVAARPVELPGVGSPDVDRLGAPEQRPVRFVSLHVGVAALIAAVVVAITAGGTYLARRTVDAPPITINVTPPSAMVDPNSVRQVTFSLDLDAFPSFAPDGTMLSYSSLRDGNLNLFVQSFAAGSQARQVTNDGQQNVQPDWSPDGQFLAYHTLARGGIWVVPATGGTTRQIAEVGSAPRWSPNGSLVAYQTGEVHGLDTPANLGPSTIWIASFPGPSAGGDRRQLTRPGEPFGGHSQPSWSSDGKRIVFVSQLVGPGEIWSVDVADGTLTRLLVCGNSCGSPVLDVDGRALFYTIAEPRRGIWRVELSEDGRSTVGTPTMLFTPIQSDMLGLTLRRDGRQLAFAVLTVHSNLEAIVTPTTAGAAARGNGTPALAEPRAVTRDTSTRNTWPSISSDGERLAFLSRRSGSGGNIWISGVDGSGARQITFSPRVNLLNAWLPGNDEVAYLTERNRRLELQAASITTGRTRVVRDLAPGGLTDRNKPFLHPRMMPDGQRFVLTRVTNGIGNLWMAAPGVPLRQITHDAESAGFASTSRDGKWIAYEVVRGRDYHVAVVPAETVGDAKHDEARVLTSGPGLYWPHSFSTDNTRVAVAARLDGRWRLGWVSRDTGQFVPLTAAVPANSFVRYPEWSPRGDRIVFEHAQVTGNIWLASLPPAPRPERSGTRE